MNPLDPSPHVIQDLVRRHAPAETEPGHLAILALIIRRNVLSGRAARAFRKSRLSPDAHLPHYVVTVARTRAREYDAWVAAQMPEHHSPLYHGLRAHALAIAAQFAWVPGGLSADDIAHEAFIALVGQGRLRAYSFDTPLDDWIRQFVWLRARHLSQSGPTRLPTLSLTDLDAESTLGLPTLCQCGRVGCDCDDRRIDRNAALVKLRPTCRRVAQLWLEGHSVEETASALGMTVAAVSNRRTRIRAALRGSQDASVLLGA